MRSKSVAASLSLFAVVALAAMSRHAVDGASSASRCSDDELDEAQKSFRNCVDSAKAGIVSRHGVTGDDEDGEDAKDVATAASLCDELVNFH
jgi:hypothetical protein